VQSWGWTHIPEMISGDQLPKNHWSETVSQLCAAHSRPTNLLSPNHINKFGMLLLAINQHQPTSTNISQHQPRSQVISYQITYWTPATSIGLAELAQPRATSHPGIRWIRWILWLRPPLPGKSLGSIIILWYTYKKRTGKSPFIIGRINYK
jgi:hypothetical protein